MLAPFQRRFYIPGMPAPFQRRFLIRDNAGALQRRLFYLRSPPTKVLVATGNGTGAGHFKLSVMRLLRVTSKLAMLPFGNDIWRRRRAAPR
jgi:hypothetical protein